MADYVITTKTNTRKSATFTQDEVKEILLDWWLSKGLDLREGDVVTSFLNDEACTVTIQIDTERYKEEIK